jgi:hypothetical protein
LDTGNLFNWQHLLVIYLTDNIFNKIEK